MANSTQYIFFIVMGGIFVFFRKPIADSNIDVANKFYGRHYAKFTEKTKQREIAPWFFLAIGLMCVIFGTLGLFGMYP